MSLEAPCRKNLSLLIAVMLCVADARRSLSRNTKVFAPMPGAEGMQSSRQKHMPYEPLKALAAFLAALNPTADAFNVGVLARSGGRPAATPVLHTRSRRLVMTEDDGKKKDEERTAKEELDDFIAALEKRQAKDLEVEFRKAGGQQLLGDKPKKVSLGLIPIEDAAEESSEEESTAEESAGVENEGKGKAGGLRAIYKFLRPHTIRGTILASVTGVARALAEGAVFKWSLLPNAILGMIALLCGNAFIVGINQIYDVDIDRVNKPFLPVAAGELQKKAAWALVLACGITGPVIVKRLFSKLIFQLYMFGTIIGTLYSVPPFRFKRYPLIAGLTIATVRGFLLNWGVYYATCEAFGRSLVWNPTVAFLARFMTAFAGVIAVTKDLPDIEGDRKYGIKTFATKMGVGPIAAGATAALFLNYVHAVATALLAAPGVFKTNLMVAGHSFAAAYLLFHYRNLKPDSQRSVKTYYKKIWDLFYLEYAMYPFI